MLDEKDATAAKVRVLMESNDFTSSWNTVGVSGNVIEASWEALLDSIRYALLGMAKIEPEWSEARGRFGVVNH